MQTLIINGSPRKNGDSMTLVNEMIKYLEGSVQIIDTYNSGISPCTDCRYCMHNKGCCIDDGMQDVYKLLNEADNVIMSSPIYFSELSGQLLSFASRFQMFFASKYIRKDSTFSLKNKKGVLVISAGGSTDNFKNALSTANIIFNEMNAELVGTVMSVHTDKVPAQKDTAALKKARELVVMLNKANH